jgi:hypothetical protein
VVIALNVNVLRFISVTGVKEESVRSDPQDRGHALNGIVSYEE